MASCKGPIIRVCFLSNDPGKTGSHFFCYGAIRFPHIELFDFHTENALTYKKAVYEIKCIETPFLKMFFFFCKRIATNHKSYKQKPRKVRILHVPQIGFLCYLDSSEILL